MKKHEKRLPQEPDGEFPEFPEIAETAASMECTGLMPTAPRTLTEWEAYKALFSMEMSEDEFWHRP